MIEAVIERWEERKHLLKDVFSASHPETYGDIVKTVVSVLASDKDDRTDPFNADPDRIHEIDGEDNSGAKVYIIGDKGRGPYDYWYVQVVYGSCAGCDILEGIGGYSRNKPTSEEVRQYMLLALHIVQNIKKVEFTACTTL